MIKQRLKIFLLSLFILLSLLTFSNHLILKKFAIHKKIIW